MFYGGLYLVQKTGVNTARTLYLDTYLVRTYGIVTLTLKNLLKLSISF